MMGAYIAALLFVPVQSTDFLLIICTNHKTVRTVLNMAYRLALILVKPYNLNSIRRMQSMLKPTSHVVRSSHVTEQTKRYFSYKFQLSCSITKTSIKSVNKMI